MKFKYYVSNIDERSTRKGIMSYFNNNGVELHELNLFRSRNDTCYAQIVVNSQYMDPVESDDFPWPDNVYCTYWKDNNRNQRRGNKRRNERTEDNRSDGRREPDRCDERRYHRNARLFISDRIRYSMANSLT